MSDKKFTTHGNEPIEARIVAWVLGEASAFEAEELQRLCEEQPELAVFKRRIEAVHGLVADAHDRSNDSRWKLSTKKRAAIEELIGAEEEAADDLARDQRAGQSGRRALLAIAACLVFTVVVAGVMTPVMLGQKKKANVESTRDFGLFTHADEKSASLSLDEGEFAPSETVDYLTQGEKSVSRYRSGDSRGKALKSPQAFGKGNALADNKSDYQADPFAAGPRPESERRSPKNPAAKAAPSSLSGFPVVPASPMAGESLGGRGQAGGDDRFDAPELANNAKLEGGRIPSSRTASNLNGVAPADDTAVYAFKERGGKRNEGKDLGEEGFTYENAAPTESTPGSSLGADEQSYTLLSEDEAKEVNRLLNREQLLVEVEANSELELKPQMTASLARREMEELRDQLEKDASGALHVDELLDKKNSGDKQAFRAKLQKCEELANRPNVDPAVLKALEEDLTLEVAAKIVTLDEDAEKKAKQEPRERPVVTDEETVAAEEPYSTFSLNINDASFRVAQAALARGEMPDPSGIKVEQFYNAVDYGDPAPGAGQPVTSKIEQTAHPVIPGRNLVRIAIKTASEGRSQGQPLRLTLLIDQSGSMSREDRRTAMVEALDGLRGLLKEHDQVNIIGFARTPRLLGEAIKGNQGQLGQLVNIEANEGGTNLEEALKLGQQLAQRHHLEGAQNRMVLFTDGAANLGDADPDSLADKIKDLRQKGISFDIAGIVADGLNDELLSEMARHGDGRYYVVGKGGKDRFAEQLAGAFRPAAENVKVQVHFNPERVGRYKLIGFEKDRLNKEDFRDDSVDAAEMAAEEAGVAIYQVETLPEGDGEIGEVSVRFRDVASDQMVERSWTIANQISTPAIDQAQPSMQLATLAMLAGEKLRGGPLADAINFNEMGEVIAQVNQHFKSDPKAAEMLEMVEQLK